MKVFFDTDVYVAETLHDRAAERLIDATFAADWRVYNHIGWAYPPMLNATL